MEDHQRENERETTLGEGQTHQAPDQPHSPALEQEPKRPESFLGEEKLITKKNGLGFLILCLILLGSCVVSFVMLVVNASADNGMMAGVFAGLSAVLMIGWIVVAMGIKSVKPNEAAVFTLFGEYYGTIKDPGLYFIHPLVSAVEDQSRKQQEQRAKKRTAKENEAALETTSANRVSLKMKALNNECQKVNDLLGNPVVLETVVIWHVANPTKAVFNVDNYTDFLSTQADSVVRNIARLYPYDNLEYDDVEDSEKTLMGSAQTIADEMCRALQKKVVIAGIEVEEVRISHLSYAEEIAAAMLQRQQASAIVAARSKIVDGAVGMVEMALDQLAQKDIVSLDEERKAQMVSNLLVVLCATKEVAPVVNSGSIY